MTTNRKGTQAKAEMQIIPSLLNPEFQILSHTPAGEVFFACDNDLDSMWNFIANKKPRMNAGLFVINGQENYSAAGSSIFTPEKMQPVALWAQMGARTKHASENCNVFL